jgi:uncharacterized protein (TIGR03437 family)
MKSLLGALFLFFSIQLFAQNCTGPQFSGTKQAAPFTPGAVTGLIRQNDGSYTGVTIPVSPPYRILGLQDDFQNVILAGCATQPSGGGIPAFRNTPPTPGVASQIVAIGDFLSSGIPSAAFTATPSPQPNVRFAFIGMGGVVTSNMPVPNGAATVAAGDFNGDGHLDIAVAYTGGTSGTPPGGVAILLGNGDGSFQSPVSYPVGKNTLHLTVADLNGDGKLDIAAVGDGSNSVGILIGNGDGTFRAATSVPVGTGPVSVIAADFNRDGKLDLATSNEDGTVSILLGNGNGTFQAARSVPAGDDCAYLAAGDFNGDGKPDLVVTNLQAASVVVLLGNGDGTFGAPSAYGVVFFPTSLIVTDFNNDGKPDIVVGTGTPDVIAPDFGSGKLAVLLGNGDGTFQGTRLLTAGAQPDAVATGDFNGDGKADFVTANKSSGDISVFLGQGNGTFQALTANKISTGQLLHVATADLNGDGKADLVTIGDRVGISLGKGDGTFQPATFLTAGTNSQMSAIGDLNGDGRPDVVVANSGGDLNTNPGNLSIFLSSGGGNFQAARTVAAGSHPNTVAIVDINGDGKPDLIVSNGGSIVDKDGGGIEVLLGNGDGTFKAPVLYPAGFYPRSLTVGDVNLDGKPDIVAATNDANRAGQITVLLGRGDGTFAPATLLKATLPNSLVIGDFNGDGQPDLMVANCCGDTGMSYFLGNGDGTFSPEAILNGGAASPLFVATADFNGDGKPDLVTVNQLGRGGSATVLLNTTQAQPPPPPQPTFANTLAAGGSANVAPESLVSAVPLASAQLAPADVTPTDASLVANLAGTTVTVQDSAGKNRPALIAHVAPGEVDYQMPPGTATGTATVTITSPGGVVNTGQANVVAVSPGLFTTGDGVAGGYVLRILSDGTQRVEPIAQPIALNADDQVFLVLSGTGMRAASTSDMQATVGGFDVAVQSNGADSTNAALDQIAVGPIPQDLSGQGNVPVALTVTGIAANQPYVTIQ